MWSTPRVTVAPSSEPVTQAQAKAQCRVTSADNSFNDELDRLIKVARAFVEQWCGVKFPTQTVEAQCDEFADMARLPVAPIQSVTSISYIDQNGDPQTLANTVYRLVADDYQPVIKLKSGQRWPSIQSGSRITMVVVAGRMTVPEDICHAMLLLIANWFATKEAAVTGTIATEMPMGVEALLANHRR